MALYREGKAAMAEDGTVTGTGTKWQSSLSLIRPGATIMFLSSPIQMAVVNKVVSDTEIKAITTNGAVVASTDYAILLSDSLTVDGLAQDVAETLRYYQSQETVIEEAVDFFKYFDFEALQNLANQIKADSEAAESSAAAAAASEDAAKTSETNAKASEESAKAAMNKTQQIINDAGEQSTLVALASSEGLKYIGFCSSLDEMRAVIPDQINQKISLLGVYSGDASGGDEFISVNATEHPADNQGVCFNSGDPSFNWYRLRVLREKIIYLEDFSCIESTPDNLIDCTTQLKNAFTWATAQKSGVYKIKSRGNFYKVSGSLGVVDFGFTEIAFDSPVTIYAPDSASITEEYTVFEFKMTQRNSVEQSYQSRSMVGDNLNVKGTNRRTSLVTAYYIHDMWGCNLGISYHGVGTGIVFGSNVWCIGIRGLLSAQLCISNEKATSTAGENICFMPGSILYNSGRFMDLSHYQFFVNLFGTSLDYTPGQLDAPVLDLGNSVVNQIGGHIEYAGPSYSAFAKVDGDFGGFHIIGGELLLVVDSSSHYDYFAETKRDYQFSIKDTHVFGTRMVGKALCNKKMRYAPSVNYGSTQNISRISDNGGNVLYDPTFSTGVIKDKWHVVGGTQTDRFTTAFAAISVVEHSNAGSGYALKISKLVTGAGNNVSVRLEVKSKNVFLSPSISFKIESSEDVTGQVITNLNPWLVNMRDAYGIALSAGRVMTSQTPRSTSVNGMAANEPVTVTLNTVEMVNADNIPPDIYLLDISLQNLPIGTYYIYDVNYCQGDA